MFPFCNRKILQKPLPFLGVFAPSFIIWCIESDAPAAGNDDDIQVDASNLWAL